MNKEYKTIPYKEGDDDFIAEKLGAVTGEMIREAPAEGELVVFKVTDGDGKIIAGCNLLIDCWKTADLDILWVEETYRRQGVGSALIAAAQRAAWERGCRRMTLGTFDFQARSLYEKHGFKVIGTIEDCPTKGHTHYDMMKQLDAACAVCAPCAFEIVPGDEADAEYIDDQLVAYNWSQVPAVRDFEWIGRTVPGDGGNPVAGCFAGVNFWNIAFIDMLWVDEPCRGVGLGARLLQDTERAVKEAGAFLILADARDWNVDFFKKRGYTVYCTLDGCPEGYRKYKLQKRL